LAPARGCVKTHFLDHRIRLLISSKLFIAKM
jgi:hypothetical protein